MPDPQLIREAEAGAMIAEIDDPAIRSPIKMLISSLIDFHRESPVHLQGDFDLVFFLNVLKETVDEIYGLLRGTTPIEYWFEDYPQTDAVEANDTSPTGFRQAHAFNFAARHGDRKIQAALLTLITRANVKQKLLLPTVKGFKYRGPMPPPIAEAPARPMDFLFMVEAIAKALGPGQAARGFFEESARSKKGDPVKLGAISFKYHFWKSRGGWLLGHAANRKIVDVEGIPYLAKKQCRPYLRQCHLNTASCLSALSQNSSASGPGSSSSHDSSALPLTRFAHPSFATIRKPVPAQQREFHVVT